MPTFNIIVHPPKEIKDEDWKHLKVRNWPIVPLKGHGINLGPKGVTGVDVKVVDIRHWLGCDDIDLHCVIDPVVDAVKEFRSLTEEDGWK